MSSREPFETAITASAPSSDRPLAQARQRVAAAELLGLPRAQRLERVHGRHVRDAVGELGQVAAEVRVPGVASGRRSAPSTPAAIDRSIDIARSAARCGASPASASQARWRRRRRRGAPQACTVTSSSVRELAREVLDVHAGAAVDLGRVLAREQRDPHASTTSPLPITTTPPSETVKRSRSASGSTPICAPGADCDVLVEDRPPHHRAAADVDALHEHRVLDLGERVDVHAGREHRAPHRRRRRSTTPAHTIESSAWPAAALFVEHELGRRQRLVPREDRPLACCRG